MKKRLTTQLNQTGKAVEIIYAAEFHLGDFHGTVEITEDMIDEMVSNFSLLNEEGRISVNVNHNSDAPNVMDAQAVGWLHGLSKQVDNGRISLMGEVQWLPETADLIQEQKFKFLSAEIEFSAKNPITGDEIGTHLFGLALTNIPAIPQLSPLELTQKQAEDVREAWNSAEDFKLEYPIQEVGSDYLIVTDQKGLWRVPFSVEGGIIYFSDDWTSVKTQWRKVDKKEEGKDMNKSRQAIDPVDEYWDEVRKQQKAHPNFQPEEIEALIAKESPAIWKRSGMANLHKPSPENTSENPYMDLFYTKSYQLQVEHPDWSLEKCRGHIQRTCKGLFKAGHDTDPQRRLIGAAEFEEIVGGLSMAEAEKKAAKLLSADATYVELHRRMR